MVDNNIVNFVLGENIDNLELDLDPVWQTFQLNQETQNNIGIYVEYYIMNPFVDSTQVPPSLQVVIEHGLVTLSQEHLEEIVQLNSRIESFSLLLS